MRLVDLRGGRDTICQAALGRRDHFMPASLLMSQMDALEEPDPSEEPLTIDIGPLADQIANEIIQRLCA